MSDNIEITYKVTEVKRLAVTGRDRQRRNVLYFSVTNQEFAKPVKELLSGFRWNNPFRDYRKLLPEVFEKLGLPKTTKARWSQKAGCSCGCSPGFILDTYTYPAENMWAEIEMNIKGQLELSLESQPAPA